MVTSLESSILGRAGWRSMVGSSVSRAEAHATYNAIKILAERSVPSFEAATERLGQAVSLCQVEKQKLS